jgi:hypothetical protein
MSAEAQTPAVDKYKYSAQLGDLQVTVTAAGPVSPAFDERYGLRPRTGYHIVVVNLRFRNVALFPSCSYFDVWLRVNLGYEYQRSTAGHLKWPQADGLLATEESEGSYAFEVKDGTKPVAVKLVRNTLGEDFCRMMQHRAGSVSGPGIVSLPLEGLSSPTRQEQEPARPVTRPKKESLPGRNVVQAERKESAEPAAGSAGTAGGESQAPAAAPEESGKPTVPLAEAGPPIAAQGPISAAGPQPKPELRIFVTDRKSWEASGAFGQNSGTGAGGQRWDMRSPKAEILKAFRERCPDVLVTMQRERAAYIVILDHSEWRSPSYKVTVFRPSGDVIYSGGAELLRNVVKNACYAVTAPK